MSVTGPVLVAYTGDMSVLHFTQEPAITKAPKKRRVRNAEKNREKMKTMTDIKIDSMPVACSGERSSFTVPDYGIDVKRYNRFHGSSFRNAGRKPYRHVAHLRRIKFGVKRLCL